MAFIQQAWAQHGGPDAHNSGRMAGDRVLAAIGRQLKAVFKRRDDMFFRLGVVISIVEQASPVSMSPSL
jgi:hypothetical protein